MQLVSNFNERFKEAFQGRSVTDFANQVGVSKQTISAYLNGTRKPKRIVAETIARHLNVSPAWLFGYDVAMDAPTTNDDSGRTAEFVKLFSQLTAEQQHLIISQIKGILSNQ